MRKITFYCFCLAIWMAIFIGGCKQAAKSTELSDNFSTGSIPSYVLNVLKYVDTHQRAPMQHVGGRRFKNLENLLPKFTVDGRVIGYKEWDVHPKQKGRNRGPERLVTGNNSSAYYTKDHYQTFNKIR